MNCTLGGAVEQVSKGNFGKMITILLTLALFLVIQVYIVKGSYNLLSEKYNFENRFNLPKNLTFMDSVLVVILFRSLFA